MPAKLFLRKLNEITPPNEIPKELITKEKLSTKEESSTIEEPSKKDVEDNKVKTITSVCYLFISGSCEGNCGKLHKNKSDLSNDELEGYNKWETRKNKKSKPKKVGVPWSGPCFFFASNKCNKKENCWWEHKNRNDYTQEEEESFRDPNSNGWKRTYKPKVKPPPPTTPLPSSNNDMTTLVDLMKMKFLLDLNTKIEPPPSPMVFNIKNDNVTTQTTTQTTTTSTQAPWWNNTWGSWNNSWGSRTPTYCVHGSAWSHCYTGPPYHCVHGSRWGSCCFTPF